MREFDPSQYAEADRREVNPPLEVEAATSGRCWRSWIGGSENAESGSDAYGGQAVVKGGSRLVDLRLKESSERRLTRP